MELKFFEVNRNIQQWNNKEMQADLKREKSIQKQQTFDGFDIEILN